MSTTPTPLKYRGVRYRSALEAKWAAFFRHLGWAYTYDPLPGQDWPTFLVNGGGQDYFICVTPEVSTRALGERIGAASELNRATSVPTVVVGLTPFLGRGRHHVAGVLPRGRDRGEWGEAAWYWIPAYGLCLTSLGNATGDPADVRAVEEAWAKATNEIGALL